MQDKLVKIGVFYDGNYFLQVSNYYAYGHSRRRRISINGIQQFILNKVANEEGVEQKLCKIIESHYYRGRLNAADASAKGDTLYYERVFDDILMSERVTPHYTAIKLTHEGYRQEKGIDVWLALDAYEMSLYKKFSVVVLIASDGDYVPLVRKLNSLGIRVMVLGWDFEYITDMGSRQSTRTSQQLLEEASYPVQMAQLIDDRVLQKESLINNLFVTTAAERRPSAQPEYVRPVPAISAGYATQESITAHATSDLIEDNFMGAHPGNNLDEAEVHHSEVIKLFTGYGFISFPPNNLFFHYTSLVNDDFNNLQIGDQVTFIVDKNDQGQDVAKNVKVIFPDQPDHS